ncbi:MAG: class I SAM-dependent methyltransferase [Pseudomonadota bacterium]
MQAARLPSPSQTFWDRIAPKYAKQPIKDPAAYEAKLARVRALLSPLDHVLEIGCGTGATAIKLAPGVAQVTGTDGSQGMIDIARRRLGPNAPRNVAFQKADAEDMVEGQPFDAICAFSLLHLVDDLPRVLTSVRGQLKPGGLFISKTVALKNGNVLMRLMVRAMMAIGVAPRVIFLSTDDIVRGLVDAGFEIEDKRYLSKSRINPFIVARRKVSSSRAA